MSDTTDHAAAIREITSTLESWGDDVYLMGEDEPAIGGMLLRINNHADALAAENAALRRYARALQEIAFRDARPGDAPIFIRSLQREHGVAAIMAREGEE